VDGEADEVGLEAEFAEKVRLVLEDRAFAVG